MYIPQLLFAIPLGLTAEAEDPTAKAAKDTRLRNIIVEVVKERAR